MLNLNTLFRRKPRVLIFINLIQDLDMLLPLAIAFKENSAVNLDIAVIDRSWHESPRIGHLLLQAGFKPKRISKAAAIAGLQPSLSGVKALITASESSCGPHKAAYELTKRANKSLIPTYTLQHGFENVGLTYSDSTYPIETTQFASKTIFIWGELDTLHPNVSEETRKKCITVGCPKHIKAADHPSILFTHHRRQLVAVFENLHWDRYDESYRHNFLVDLTYAATQFPQLTFLIKPHHAGRWLTDRYCGELPTVDNLIIADPLDPQWEGFTAPAILSIADAAITTPSTVAIDTAFLQRPIAIVGYDLELTKYQPLPIFKQSEDWIDWIGKICTTKGYSSLQDIGQSFLQQQVAPRDAISGILAKVIDQLD